MPTVMLCDTGQKDPFVKQASRVYKALLWRLRHGCKRKTNYQLLFPSSHTNRHTGVHAHLITIIIFTYSTEKKQFSHYTLRLFQTGKLCRPGGGTHLSLTSTDFPIFCRWHLNMSNFCQLQPDAEWTVSLQLAAVGCSFQVWKGF